MNKFKRTKQKDKPSALLTSDWHLREDIPQCRTDNFWETQERKIDFVFDLARKNQCPIIIGGDIGHKPRWSCRLLEWFISKVDKDIKIFLVSGQHDLINHKLSLWEQSGIGVLHAAKAINFIQKPIWINEFGLFPFSYGEEIKRCKSTSNSNIAIIHQMVIEDKSLWPGQEAPKGHQILKKFPCYNLILSGDNHNAFVTEHEGRFLVNPGSMMRTTADQENHKPRVYLWYAETNIIDAVYLPIEQGVISRTHIEVTQNRENRNKAFIERINNNVEIKLSYEKNLEAYFDKYRTEKNIKEKVWISVE